MSVLFDAVEIGDFKLKNRMVLAPLTRCRASPGRIPNLLMRDYYLQRATAGLLFTEATAVSPMGVGYPNTPGIWSPEQVAGWKPITEAVHAQGGTILLQLWHVGRISHPSYLDGKLPVAPSAIAADGHVRLLSKSEAYPVPRALLTQEIPDVVADFRRGAENAKAAGFDGVEIHGANGYLPDQFLQDGSNHRTDAYGGPVANRARFLLEITDAAIGIWGARRVGIHLAPRGDTQSMGDSDPAGTFGYVARAMRERNVAFLFTREKQGPDRLSPILKKAFGGALIANEGFTKDSAEKELRDGNADAVAFGQLFIANPDLPMRFIKDSPLNVPNPKTFYAPGPEGYTDYPTREAEPRPVDSMG